MEDYNDKDDLVLLKAVAASDSEEEPNDGDNVVLIKSPDITDEQHLEDRLTDRYYCGVPFCRPKWLQIFAKKKFFTFLLFLFALTEGAIVSGRSLPYSL